LKRLIGDVPLYLLAAVSATIAVLDSADVFNNVTWIRDRLAPLTLLAVGVICWYLAAERRSKWEHLEKVVTQTSQELADRLVGAEVKVFRTPQDYWSYAAKQILGAKESIEDVTWGKIHNRNATRAANDAFAKYRDAISKVASSRNAKGLVYREIMTFEYPLRVRRARRNLEQNAPNYSLAYYQLPEGSLPPFLQFVVIDCKEVLFGPHRGAQPGFGESFLAIEHPELAALFREYFDVAWKEATTIKDYHGTDWELFEEIAQRVGELPKAGSANTTHDQDQAFQQATTDVERA
jgi:hypothetical protein